MSDSKRWDKPLSSIIGLWGTLIVWIVAGLNVRFGWPPPIPIGWQILGVIVFVLSTLFGTWAMLENRFFSAVVRIQTDRGHTVVTTGPYRFMRHPGYAAGILGYLAMPLLLNSLWAFIPALLTIVLIIVRTKLEDETLQAELPDYGEYA
jgi:protein-S-isoprenylcysteine O-methyltransferase Ste14